MVGQTEHTCVPRRIGVWCRVEHSVVPRPKSSFYFSVPVIEKKEMVSRVRKIETLSGSPQFTQKLRPPVVRLAAAGPTFEPRPCNR